MLKEPFGPEIDLPLTDLIRDTLGDIPAQSSFGWNLNEKPVRRCAQ
jgi:hypothetical protein